MTKRGDLCAANASVDKMLPCALRMMEELKPRDYLELMASRTAWVLWLCMLGRKSDARALLHAEQFDGLESMVDWLAAAAPAGT